MIGCRVLTSTISTVSMASTRETSGGSSLQDLDLLCCSGRSLDLWLTNGETSLVDSFALFSPHQLLDFFMNNVGECFNRIQGSEEGLHHLLHNLHSKLHHEAFSTIQSFDVGSNTRRDCYVAALLGFRVMACCRA